MDRWTVLECEQDTRQLSALPRNGQARRRPQILALGRRSGRSTGRSSRIIGRQLKGDSRRRALAQSPSRRDVTAGDRQAT